MSGLRSTTSFGFSRVSRVRSYTLKMRTSSSIGAGWSSTRMSIQRSLKPAYPPPCRTTRIAALCWPRLSPPARCPALNAVSRRTGRSPCVISKARANAFKTSSLARMFPWAAKFRPTICPAHGKHSFPVYDAARPRASTTPTWRCAASLSPVTSLFTTSFGATPRFNIARASRPYAVFAYACVATAPTRAAAKGTTAPTATNFDSTATPRSFVFGSNATMLNVDGRVRAMPSETSGRYFAVSPFPQRLSSPRISATPSMHVLLDLYGVLLDHEKMFRGYRERLAELLMARFGGDPDVWRRAHDEAWVTYVQRVNSVDWESSGYADIVDELDARHLLEIFERVGVTGRPADTLAVSREFEREAMSHVNARYSDARTAIERLRSAGHRVYVATGGSETNDAALRGAGLFDLIDRIFTGHSQNAQKGQSRYWQEIPHQLGVKPRDCVLVDDRLDYLEAAASVGIVALLLDRKAAHRPESMPPYVEATLRNLAGLPHWVELWTATRHD